QISPASTLVSCRMRGLYRSSYAFPPVQIDPGASNGHRLTWLWRCQRNTLRLGQFGNGRQRLAPCMEGQIEGAIVMGVGMGLFERMEYDPRFGNPVNNNLADYIVPSHADTPDMDVTFLDYPDKALNEYGARGVGEIGLAGVASAICAGVQHATGVRVRDLPVKIEDLLTKRG
ncbi:MAG: xanthine dehydrogenase family protein molybdopterin-binding subunit, partial [Cytophagaceae bacterium]